MVSYLRDSRESQGKSGLGIEAQRADVKEYVEKAGCELLHEYVEIETGKKHDLDNRPELRRAIAHAKRSKAVLVVAKLDRLLRSTVICNMLKTSGVQFVACDNPNANEFQIDILAAVAANEVREISKRTKKALAALKARDVKLGSARSGAPKLTDEARNKGRAIAAAAIGEAAKEAYSDIAPTILGLQARGETLGAIAAQLNADGHTTRRGKDWSAPQVLRVLKYSTQYPLPDGVGE
jgi:DNA invertase Pin-like site-specific DNA recombinase